MPRQKSKPNVKGQLKQLKKAGLYSGDLRKPPTKYGKSLLKKFRDVLVGKSKVVSVPSRKEAKNLKQMGYEVKANKVILPSPDKNVKLYYSKVTGNIVRKSKVNGEDFEARSLTGREEGGEYLLVTHDHVHVIGDKKQLNKFLNDYQAKWPDISAYVFWQKGEDGKYKTQSKKKKTKKKTVKRKPKAKKVKIL